MTTYVYETIPKQARQKPRYFEIKQSMNDAPLARHPETGEAIRRVVLGGFGVLSSGNAANQSSSANSSCGPGCGCH
jgi:predicted nucleic acid-binding Zn ribbon protein